MSISINCQSCIPPGFRFHPTEEELLNYYLMKKVASEKIDLDVIRTADLNKFEPWDIQEKCKIGSTPQNDWYFFSHKDKKYPTGTRTNRATATGFWKATGRDKVIYSSIQRLGMRKTLVFYKGRAPHGQKSDWIMHEYRLDDQTEPISLPNASCLIGDMSAKEDGWVVCRMFKKKTHQKSTDNPNNCSSSSSSTITGCDSALDQILQYMGRSCKQETDVITNLRYFQSMEAILGAGSGGFMKLPSLESSPLSIDIPPNPEHQIETYSMDGVSTDLSDLDRLVATHLNGQSWVSRELDCFEDIGLANSQLVGAPQYYNHQNNIDGGGDDLWSFTMSVSALISDHVSP